MVKRLEARFKQPWFLALNFGVLWLAVLAVAYFNQANNIGVVNFVNEHLVRSPVPRYVFNQSVNMAYQGVVP